MQYAVKGTLKHESKHKQGLYRHFRYNRRGNAVTIAARHYSCVLNLMKVLEAPVAQWFRHYDTSRKVACSRPEVVIYFFSIYLILPAALGPGVHSASNRNEYQKQKKSFCGVNFGRCVSLTLPPSVSRLSR
jgi:hypothetical protein